MVSKYSKSERELARKLHELAAQRDYEKLFEIVNNTNAQKPEDIWELQKFLNDKSKEFDEKYSIRDSELFIFFCRAITENLLTLEELEGLPKDDITAIKDITSS